MITASAETAAAAITPRADIAGSGDPQALLQPLAPVERAERDRGLALFNTDHVAAGTPGAAVIDGLGPVFNAASCDACHNSGHRARGPIEPDRLPVGFVLQLGYRQPRDVERVYGEVLNTQALPGLAVEGRLRLRYDERRGRYPDGSPWRLREPRYELRDLPLGRLPAGTVIRPRIAPPVFGAGLIDAARLPSSGRFGWTAEVPSLAEQTALAYAHEMGITSRLQPVADCGPRDRACLEAPSGGTPEVSDADFAAVVAFQRNLPVPAAATLPAEQEAAGRALFEAAGCLGCHAGQTALDGLDGLAQVTMWSDLRPHALGAPLADRSVEGRPQPTRFRTAPLWGLAAAIAKGPLLLLHDGRAETVEQAILWHDGEARAARLRFEALAAADRRRLLDWVEAR